MGTTDQQDNIILKALQSVENENGNLYNCLFQMIETREAIEANLNAVENKVSTISQDIEQLESINAINFYKVQNLEKEANDLEEKQTFFKDTVKSLEGKIKDFKESSEGKMDDFVRESEKLTEHFLSAVDKESTESECVKSFDEIRTLKSKIEEKEGTLFKLKKELEEFVSYGTPENPIETSVSLEERQFVMNILEEQLINIKKMNLNLKNRKTGLETEDYELARTHHMTF